MKLRPVALLAVPVLIAGLALPVTANARTTPTASRVHSTLSHQLDTRAARAAFWHRRPAPHLTAGAATTATAPLTAAQQLTRSLAIRRGSSGSDEVTVRGTSTTALRAAVAATGGRLLGAAPDAVTALIPHNALGTLEHASGVSSVHAPERAWVQSGPTSEGVGASGADAWQTNGDSGAGVIVGIVDGGFAGLDDAVAAGDLPAGLQVSSSDNHCGNVDDTDHGTAVAEIVHEMAPGATLKLYCIDDNIGMTQAAQQIVTDGVSVVNCSLGFVGDSRGDGSTPSESAAAAVATVRRAGILWVESAGNDGADHWSGTFADADKDKLLDLDGTGAANEDDDEIVLGSNDVGTGGGSADLVLRWDQWPTSSAPVTLEATGYQCTDEDCNDTPTALNGGKPIKVSQVKNTQPWVDIPISNPDPDPQIWDITVVLGTGFPKVHYDLNYEGDVGGSYLANAVDPVRGAAGSIDQPADSPDVLAVGAAYVGDPGTGAGRGTLEYFSSQGPTIDRRTKPDITGYDGVSSPVYGTYDPNTGTGGFFGTSSSSPHVAGAAALVKAANPTMDAAQIQNFLEQRANNGSATNPASNSTGHGLLTLGSPSGVQPPTTANYQALTTPARVLDTRTTVGGHHSKVGNGGVVTVSFPGLPADATAVAINLTGVGATGSGYLSAYPTGTAAPSTSNLNLSKTDSTAAVLAIVSLNANRTITVRNVGTAVNVLVDELGWFGTGSTETGRYTPLPTPARVLDTRTTTGGHHGLIAANGSAQVTTNAPSGSIAAIVNVTATSMKASGFLGTGPSCSLKTSTLNFQKATRANLAIVGLDQNGRFCIANGPTATNVIVDVEGFLGSSGSGYVALPAPQRIVDTRTGNGGSAGGHASKALAANTTTSFYGSNVGDVPASATALLTGVVEASTTTGASYLSVFPGTTKPASLSSTVNFSPGRVVANASVTGLSSDQFAAYNSGGSTHIAIDLFGYFAPPSG